MIRTNFLKRLISSFVLIPFSLFMILKGSFYFNFFLFLLFLISIFECKRMIKNSFFIIAILFLIISFLSAYTIRNNYTDFGSFIFIFLILISISSDIGGYVFGKVFKGKKLTKISPNKTYSGMYGSFILSILFTFIYTNKISTINLFPVIENFKLLALVISLSFVSQIGDLIVSYFKRKSNISDTGKLIPGHGGLLDRIDGMIFVFPIFLMVDSLIGII